MTFTVWSQWRQPGSPPANVQTVDVKPIGDGGGNTSPVLSPPQILIPPGNPPGGRDVTIQPTDGGGAVKQNPGGLISDCPDYSKWLIWLLVIFIIYKTVL